MTHLHGTCSDEDQASLPVGRGPMEPREDRGRNWKRTLLTLYDTTRTAVHAAVQTGPLERCPCTADAHEQGRQRHSGLCLTLREALE